MSMRLIFQEEQVAISTGLYTVYCKTRKELGKLAGYPQLGVSPTPPSFFVMFLEVHYFFFIRGQYTIPDRVIPPSPYQIPSSCNPTARGIAITLFFSFSFHLKKKILLVGSKHPFNPQLQAGLDGFGTPVDLEGWYHITCKPRIRLIILICGSSLQNKTLL